MGTAENVGYSMTFKTLKNDAQKIICRSITRTGDEPLSRNLHIDPTIMPAVVMSRQETFEDNDTVSATTSALPDDVNYQAESYVPIIKMSDFMGRSLDASSFRDRCSLCNYAGRL